MVFKWICRRLLEIHVWKYMSCFGEAWTRDINLGVISMYMAIEVKRGNMMIPESLYRIKEGQSGSRKCQSMEIE